MAGADVNVLDAANDGPLHLAIKGGHVGIAKDLLLSGANPVQAGSFGDFPIHLAAQHGLDEVVLALVQKGVGLDCLNDDGETPLYVALWWDHVATMKVLLAEGADPNTHDLTHLATQKNNAAAIPALFEAGADIEGRCGTGHTPLEFAAMGSSCAAMLTLLQLRANVNSKNEDEETPLYLACSFGHHDAADLLLRWGADETAVDAEGETIASMVMR
ncbi:unnamed protein product, partial [Ectocarpus fasciculatus]